jgi:Gas vesicle synthesis protein GvpL/GvpF
MNEQTHRNMWVYGVVPAGARLKELKRRSDRLPADIRVLEVDDLGAIVGDAPPQDAKATRDQALAHARVLEAAVLDAPVVPFRFGMVLPDDSAGSELLRPWHDRLAQLLEAVKDRVQLTLKATYHEDAVLREIVESEPEVAALRELTREGDEIETRDARVRLGELVAMALEQWRQRDAGAIVNRLEPRSVAYTIAPLESEFMVLNAPFLVERRRTGQFEATAEAVANEQAERMHVALHGPMPAFDFIDGNQPPWA